MNERNVIRIAVLLAAVGVLAAGCAVGPDYHAPHPNAPARWIGSTNTQAAQLTRWWRQFHDPELTRLVEEALATNLDVRLAEAKLRESRAARGVIAGSLWPSVNGSAGYQRTRTATSSNTLPQDENLYQAGFDALWEIDIFGGLRRSVESADATVQAAQEGLRDAQVSLAAEVARDYIQLRGLQAEIAVAEDNLKAQQHTATITRERQQAGFVSALDVANADSQVATTRARIPVLQASAQQAIYALSVLLARSPGYLLNELSTAKPLPVTPPSVPVGLPSDLLRRRPDIREAEAQLHAATAQIGVATAELFPSFSLTGNVSWQSNLLHTWFNDPSLASAIGPTVNWALFQGGAIRSNISAQEALRDQAFITYQKTVLTAFQDVENALFAYRTEWVHRQALSEAVESSQKAVAIARQMYSAGQTDFLNVLQAQAALYLAEDAFVQSNSAACQDLIALYKALGGGWETKS